MENQPTSLLEISEELEVACIGAIGKWGNQAQFIQTMAECGELVSAIGHLFQNRSDAIDEVLSEAADVMIMVAQIREIFGHERFHNVLRIKYNKFYKKVFSND